MQTHFVGEFADSLALGILEIYKNTEFSRGRLNLGEIVNVRPGVGNESRVIVRFRGSRELCSSYLDQAFSRNRPVKVELVVPDSAILRRSARKNTVIPTEEEESAEDVTHRRSVSFDRKIKTEKMGGYGGIDEDEYMMEDLLKPRKSSLISPFCSPSPAKEKYNRDDSFHLKTGGARFTLKHEPRQKRQSNTPISKARRVSTPASLSRQSQLTSHSSTSAGPSTGCRKDRKMIIKLQKQLKTMENSLRNVERYVEYMAINTLAKPVTRYRGVEFLDRDKVSELSRSTPNSATFLRYIMDALFYGDAQSKLPSCERDSDRILYAKDLFFTLRCSTEDEARKKWNELLAYYDDNVVRRRSSSTTWKEKRPKVKSIYVKRNTPKKKKAFIVSDEESSEEEDN